MRQRERGETSREFSNGQTSICMVRIYESSCYESVGRDSGMVINFQDFVCQIT